MTDRNPQPPKTKTQLQRDKRLAEALRSNLRRRKMAGSAAPPESDGDMSKDGKPPEPDAED